MKGMLSFNLFYLLILLLPTCNPFVGAFSQNPLQKRKTKQSYPDKNNNNNNKLQKSFLEWFKNSEMVQKLHTKHIQSSSVDHMMKSTILVNASDENKIKFANSQFGKIVSDTMAMEYQLLGEWKVQKIVEAASLSETDENNVMKNKRLSSSSSSSSSMSFDVEGNHKELLQILEKKPITLFSFVDCPWCLLAKKCIQEEVEEIERMSGYDSNLSSLSSIIQIIELEYLGWKGKELRASIALATGRTSMPACFIGGFSIGGYTDGFLLLDESSSEERVENEETMFIPESEFDLRFKDATGIKDMKDNGRLRDMITNALHQSSS